MDLNELAARVDSKETFLEFVSALRADWYASRGEGPAPNCWENPDLGRFLEAMQAWTEASGARVPEPPDWRTFADMLMAAVAAPHHHEPPAENRRALDPTHRDLRLRGDESKAPRLHCVVRRRLVVVLIKSVRSGCQSPTVLRRCES